MPLVVAIALAGAVIAPGALGERLRSPTGDDIGLREDLWNAALDIYATSPVVGVGLANFGEAYTGLPAQPAAAPSSGCCISRSCWCRPTRTTCF